MDNWQRLFKKQIIFSRRQSRTVECGLLLTVCNCRQFTADKLRICVIFFGLGTAVENQCEKEETPCP